jgi:hypothetical protein
MGKGGIKNGRNHSDVFYGPNKYNEEQQLSGWRNCNKYHRGRNQRYSFQIDLDHGNYNNIAPYNFCNFCTKML